MHVQTSASLIQMSDKKAVWRFAGVRDGKVTGSSASNVKRPFVKLWEKLAKDGVDLMLADLEKTIQEREAAATVVE